MLLCGTLRTRQNPRGFYPLFKTMEEKRVCPICKGERFIKFSTRNENGYEYVMYKRCECLTNRKNTENPFTDKEEDGTTDKSV